MRGASEPGRSSVDCDIDDAEELCPSTNAIFVRGI